MKISENSGLVSNQFILICKAMPFQLGDAEGSGKVTERLFRRSGFEKFGVLYREDGTLYVVYKPVDALNTTAVLPIIFFWINFKAQQMRSGNQFFSSPNFLKPV